MISWSHPCCRCERAWPRIFINKWMRYWFVAAMTIQMADLSLWYVHRLHWFTTRHVSKWICEGFSTLLFCHNHTWIDIIVWVCVYVWGRKRERVSIYDIQSNRRDTCISCCWFSARLPILATCFRFLYFDPFVQALQASEQEFFIEKREEINCITL